jgi:hypothetical protein
MSIQDFPEPQGGTPKLVDRAGLIARYKHLRTVGQNLNQKLVRRLSNSVLDEGGRRLGILQNGILVFNTEDETSVLMDYCIYNVRSNGRNAVEEYLIDSPPDLDSDEMVCLRAMRDAIYSLWVVESAESGLGVMARDVRSNETVLIIDMGFGSTAEPGLIFASRLLFHDGFSMTGGAALPIAVLPQDERDAFIKKFSQLLGEEDGGFLDPAPLISACLRKGSSMHVQYQEPTGRLVKRDPSSSHSAKIGRNDPCSCGSGKKFKRCCMKRVR